jgi:hypothetical protein
MKVFFDTSAFAKRFIDEPGTETVLEYCESAEMIYLSQLCIPEFISAANRLLRDKVINAVDYSAIKNSFLKDIADITIFSISTEIIKNSVNLLEKNQLRTLDAIQLATAVKANVDMFVSSDKRQFIAAKKFGINCKLV